MHSTTTNRKSYPSDLKAGSEPVIYAYRYYHCHNSASLNGRCKAKRVRAELLEDAVFGTLLDLAGSRKLRRERLIAGRDHSEESARLIEQTQHLQAEISRARLARKDYSNVQAMLDKANAELDRIALLEPEPARIEYDETNQTFQNWWDLNDPTARNAFMREQGIKVIVSPDPLPEDLVLPRPEMIFSVAAIERPGMHAILYLGNLADLLNRASDLSITVSQR